MFSLLIGLEVVVSVLLILVVLMQSSKGGGLAGTFGGGNVGMVFGVRRTADFLIQATQGLAIAFGVLALLINMFFLPRGREEAIESVIQQGSSTQAPLSPQLPSNAPPTTQPQGAQQ
jgi:preprotein translocase subunit SecG